ncbi:MAG: DNA polymerase III subunit delta [Methyloceanibacter sp.]|uniref:DNA polymerase III subunit delta n=1 Tax=Methyloceanibacter sp. TaxID=1965321 RepID=UPI003D6D6852
MVAYKASAVARFLKSPDSSCRAALAYGPDAGLVTERAAALAETFARRQRGETEVIRLDDRDLAEEPGRLEIELRTRPMFAANKVVRVSAGSRLDVPALKALLTEPSDNALIVEAGNLRPDSGLRKLFEKLADAAALPCYSDERDLAGIIDAELAEMGLRIDPETRSDLMARLGADQALSRAEIVKLALYAQGGGSISHEDIEAIVGDAAEIALENFVYAASSGDPHQALRELQRLAAAGTDRASALSALARHFAQMHRVAAQAAGGSLDEAVRALKPRPHFKREPMFLAHCRRWGATRLAHALPLIQDAVSRSRRAPDLESAFAERLLLALTSKI